MNAVTEKPILFSAPMIRAILDGTKTQTRRVSKRAGDCPYGIPGGHLWVRETFNATWCDRVMYRADGGSAVDVGWAREPRWKPAIHMPRKASRILLALKELRLERLHNITEEDAAAEGVERAGAKMWKDPTDQRSDLHVGSARTAFMMLWDSINEDRGYGWRLNPLVWALTFERVQP